MVESEWEMMVITSTGHMSEIVNSLGSGNRFEYALTYLVQEATLVIIHGLKMSRNIVKNEQVVEWVRENIFVFSLAEHITIFTATRGAPKFS